MIIFLLVCIVAIAYACYVPQPPNILAWFYGRWEQLSILVLFILLILFVKQASYVPSI